MEQWVEETINQFGYFGIFLLIALENVFPPIPSEVILTLGGFMTTRTELHIVGVIIAATLGSVFGAVVLYVIGKLMNVERLESLIDRWGRSLRVTKDDIRRADRWFDTYGGWVVFFGRLVPLIRSLISVPAGMSDMPIGRFLLFTVAGTCIWNTALVNIGAAVGSSWGEIVAALDAYSNVVYGMITVSAVAFAFLFIKKRFRRK